MTRYFIWDDLANVWFETSIEKYVESERLAGFYPKGQDGPDVIATAAFAGAGLRGRVAYSDKDVPNFFVPFNKDITLVSEATDEALIKELKRRFEVAVSQVEFNGKGFKKIEVLVPCDTKTVKLTAIPDWLDDVDKAMFKEFGSDGSIVR
jgi:hypothetical protein